MRAGKRGEEIASTFLNGAGYIVLYRNLRIRKDEIDLIAFDPEDTVIAFIEVKTRTRKHADYRPELNLTYGKRKCMGRAARAWVHQTRYEGGWRLDLLCVVEGVVTEHYKDIGSP